MTARITINSSRVIPAEPGRSLLSALGNSGIFILSACGGRGACGTCRVKVVDGADPRLTPSEKHWLTPQDQADGIRLACQVKVERDLRIELPEETFRIREYRAQVRFIQDLTYDTKEVRLSLIDPPAMEFTAGQFAQFRMPGTSGDQAIYRSFSMASDPRDTRELTFQVKCVPKGILTPYIHQRLKVGDELAVTGPWGSVALRESDRDILFIAGGSGMSPIRSMLFDMVNRNCNRNARYFFGAKAARDLYRVEEMRDFERRLPGFHFIPALSEPDPGDSWTGERGLITDVVDRHVAAGASLDAYLCGSPMMVNACMKVLKAKGIPDDRVFFDKFV